MNRNYVKMNDNDKYLSLGNVFSIIKELSNNKNTAMQVELFCSLFNVSNINKTTVNNYCIGYRPIGIEYKRIFYELKEKFRVNKKVYIPILLSLISILDEKIYIENEDSINIINSNKKLKMLCKKLLIISKNDKCIDTSFINFVQKKINSKNLYEAIIKFLNYSILDNKQPIYIQKTNLKINKEDLDEYMRVKMYEGVSYISSLIQLSKKNNIYACAELGSLEFSGLVSGIVNYDNSLMYYKLASKKGHPKACFMVANLIISKRVKGSPEEALMYLNKAIDLNSSAALNTMGNCYLNGFKPLIKKNKNKAIYYYKKASSLGYAYAYNNLGKISEIEGNIEKALKYYKVSADMANSWALNKVGEYYRKNNELEKAYFYYLESSMSPINEVCYYSFYNLAKYFYLNDKKTYEKGLKYMEIFEKSGLKIDK